MPSFEATVVVPDQSSQTVFLLDDGFHGDGAARDGLSGGDFSATVLAGRYSVQILGTATSGPEVVSRSAETGFSVLPATGGFVGAPVESTPDANGNGLFHAVVFEQTVSISNTGTYVLGARLVGGQGELVRNLRADLVDAAAGGQYTMTLTVPGAEIVRHGVDGPWTLTNITLYDVGADLLPTAYAPDHQTAAYLTQWFERPLAPAISTLLPARGHASGGDVIALHGAGLRDVTGVSIGRARAQFVVTGDATVQVTVPPLGGGPGIQLADEVSVDVRVVTPWGQVVANDAFTYYFLQAK